MKTVYFDASIIIASILSPTGGSSALIDKVKSSDILGITSQTVINEILSHSYKIRRSSKEIFEYIQENKLIVRNRINLSDIETIKNLMIDVDDAHVFVGATLTKSDYLVSLDKKHILATQIKAKFPHLHILSPKELLEILRK